MATKKAKVETLFVIIDFDGCCFVNFDGMKDGDIEEVVFDKEKSAINAATNSMECDPGDVDSEEILTVYKLVPIAKVKRPQAVVEKL